MRNRQTSFENAEDKGRKSGQSAIIDPTEEIILTKKPPFATPGVKINIFNHKELRHIHFFKKSKMGKRSEQEVHKTKKLT